MSCLIYILPSGVQSLSHLPCFPQIAPGNNLCHYKKHLMGYFEFLHDSRIICFPLNISENLHWQYLKRRGRDSSLSPLLKPYNTHTSWITTSTIQTNGDHHFFFICIPVMYLVTFCSILFHVLAVTVELTWLLFLNIPSFNFFLTPNKSLSFTRFKISYVNRPAVVLNKVTLLFCLMYIQNSRQIQNPFKYLRWSVLRQ